MSGACAAVICDLEMLRAELLCVALGDFRHNLIEASHQSTAGSDFNAVLPTCFVVDSAQAAVGKLFNRLFYHGIVIVNAAEHTESRLIKRLLIYLRDRLKHPRTVGVSDREAERLRDIFKLALCLLFHAADKLLQLLVFFKRYE